MKVIEVLGRCLLMAISWLIHYQNLENCHIFNTCISWPFVQKEKNKHVQVRRKSIIIN